MHRPAATVADYCAVLTRSRLVPPERVSALREQWERSADADAADPVAAFGRFLVARDALTEYQAALVGRGHSAGFRVGRYTILDRIIKGEAAGVYKARHDAGRVVALKVLPASKARDEATRRRFEREGQLLCRLDHPNVVRGFEVGTAGNVAFIVMEYLAGDTLAALLERRGRFPFAEALRLTLQTLAGLEHLHERGVVHRDLKPANLMVVPPPGPPSATTLDSTLKIVDIGIGRDAGDERDLALSAEGAILGTPQYLAPEQARDGHAADIRSDIYGLGCVFYHLVAGKPPHDELALLAQVLLHATAEVPRLGEVADGVPPGFQAAFDRMTAKAPEARYATPAEAIQALTPFLNPVVSEAPATGPVLPAHADWHSTEAESPARPESVNVELASDDRLPAVALPVAVPAAVVKMVAPPVVAPEVTTLATAVAKPVVRSRLALSGRDWLMAGLGAAATLLALTAGYALSRLTAGG